MAAARLTREFKMLKASVISSEVRVKCAASNILEVHFVFEGTPASPFEGGEYWGMLKMPADYPFKPPSVLMLTPSGRFAINTRICFSFSDFHPECWNPVWTIETILVGLRSFMVDTEVTAGGVTADDATKRKFAASSKASNRANKTFVELFGADFSFASTKL